MLVLKADGLKLYSHLVSMNGRWRVSVTCYIEFKISGKEKGRVLTDWTWLEETGETGPKMPATSFFISSHSFLLACMQVNQLSTTSVESISVVVSTLKLSSRG